MVILGLSTSTTQFKLVAVTSSQEWGGVDALMKMISSLDACSNQEPKKRAKGIMGRVGHFGS